MPTKQTGRSKQVLEGVLMTPGVFKSSFTRP
jgi:hypothetical protein